jgi:hypothetical protein
LGILVVVVEVDYLVADNLQQQELLVLVVQELLERPQILVQQMLLITEAAVAVQLLVQAHQALVEMVAQVLW